MLNFPLLAVGVRERPQAGHASRPRRPTRRAHCGSAAGGLRRPSRIACVDDDDAFGRPIFVALRTALRWLGREPVAGDVHDTATLDETAGPLTAAPSGLHRASHDGGCVEPVTGAQARGIALAGARPFRVRPAVAVHATCAYRISVCKADGRADELEGVNREGAARGVRGGRGQLLIITDTAAHARDEYWRVPAPTSSAATRPQPSRGTAPPSSCSQASCTGPRSAWPRAPRPAGTP